MWRQKGRKNNIIYLLPQHPVISFSKDTKLNPAHVSGYARLFWDILQTKLNFTWV